MSLTLSHQQLLGIAFFLEMLIFLGCYFLSDSNAEVFKYAARFSGRVSLLVFLGIFGFFLCYYRYFKASHVSEMKSYMLVFSLMHIIHFGFLAMNVYLNNITLIPFKLAGGILGYAFIIVYPLLITRIKNKNVHFIYFYYLSIVMAMTYIARINGDFEGATPSIIHCAGLGSVLAFVALSFVVLLKKTKL